jgi:hypothetical protein
MESTWYPWQISNKLEFYGRIFQKILKYIISSKSSDRVLSCLMREDREEEG